MGSTDVSLLHAANRLHVKVCGSEMNIMQMGGCDSEMLETASRFDIFGIGEGLPNQEPATHTNTHAYARTHAQTQTHTHVHILIHNPKQFFHACYFYYLYQ